MITGRNLLIGYKLGAAVYLAACSVLFAVLGIRLFRWIDTKGAAAFAAL